MMEPVGTPVDFEESRWVAILSFGVTRGNQVVPDVILVILVHGEKEADVNDHLSQGRVGLWYRRYPAFQ